jgi:hypothetical protein
LLRRNNPGADSAFREQGHRSAIMLTMSETAEKSDPKLWEQVKAEVTAGDKGGKAGEWSARKAQMAVRAYKKRGGGYVGERDPHNHLHEWTEEDWGTKSGKPSGETHERYLPKKAREALSDAEYKRTTAAKRRDTAKGKQHSAQPADVAAKTRPFRDHRTKAELMAEARKRDVPGRSKMTKDQLLEALSL